MSQMLAPLQPFWPIVRRNWAANIESTHSTAFSSSTVERNSLIHKGTVVGNPLAESMLLMEVAALSPRSTAEPTRVLSTVVVSQAPELEQ
jgi:hypothetical protein